MTYSCCSKWAVTKRIVPLVILCAKIRLATHCPWRLPTAVKAALAVDCEDEPESDKILITQMKKMILNTMNPMSLMILSHWADFQRIWNWWLATSFLNVKMSCVWLLFCYVPPLRRNRCSPPSITTCAAVSYCKQIHSGSLNILRVYIVFVLQCPECFSEKRSTRPFVPGFVCKSKNS